MTFAVRYSASARDDLRRLYEYLLDHSATVEDLERTQSAQSQKVETMRDALALLLRSVGIT